METALKIFIGLDFSAIAALVGFATVEFWETFPEMVKSVMTMFFKD